MTLGAFSVAAVWIVLSGVKHSTAQTNCAKTFYPEDNTITNDESNILCKIIPLVDVGIMAGLWVILAIAQVSVSLPLFVRYSRLISIPSWLLPWNTLQTYLYVVLAAYSAGQERDHSKYDSLYDPTKPLAGDSIPLTNRGDPWASRPSTDSFANPRGYHDRSGSIASVTTVMGDKVQQPRDYDRYEQTPYPTEPGYVYTEEPGPTPAAMNTRYTDGDDSGLEYPQRSQPHPGASDL